MSEYKRTWSPSARLYKLICTFIHLFSFCLPHCRSTPKFTFDTYFWKVFKNLCKLSELTLDAVASQWLCHLGPGFISQADSGFTFYNSLLPASPTSLSLTLVTPLFFQDPSLPWPFLIANTISHRSSKQTAHTPVTVIVVWFYCDYSLCVFKYR